MTSARRPAVPRPSTVGTNAVTPLRQPARRRSPAALPRDVMHVTRDSEYELKLRDEEAFWDARVETPLSRSKLPAVRRYLNERMTGDPDREWFETISDYGAFRSGCVLGAGPGNVERHLLEKHQGLRLTVLDISAGALSRLKVRVEQEFPGRIETLQQDLNFVELPAHRFDLIVANSSLHHLVNLEHVAYQANQALTPGGFFFMEDTVGESFFQYSDEKKRLFETFVSAMFDGRGAPPRVRWPNRDDWAFSPFESVRSGEILQVLARYMKQVSVRPCASLLALTLITAESRPTVVPPGRMTRLRSRVQRALRPIKRKVAGPSYNVPLETAKGDLLLMLDRILTDTGYLEPSTAFAIYRKRR